jgi:hypothetical protein
MSKYTRHNLQKLEELYRELKIAVRYEKGNFQSGYCIVTGKDIVIVNKFFDVEARMNTLLEIIEQGKIDLSSLPEEMLEGYHRLRKSLLKSA